MQSRDRLDDLIDDAYRAAGPRSIDLRKLSESCFRHGVEQCSRMGMFDYRTGVQPAPAEEKHLLPRNHGFPGCRCQRPVDPKYPSSFLACGSDRKGQRRKGLEYCRLAGWFHLPGYKATGGIDITGDWPDRRSGKSRRADDGSTK